MSVLAVRIPVELKKEMERFDLNWSDFIRQSIREVLESKSKRDLHKRLSKIHKRVKKGTAVSIIRGIRDHA